MSEEIIKESGEYYRSYDKAKDTWTRHYFWGLAKLILLESGETVQHAIDNVSSKVLSILSQTDTSSETTAPSSKLFHDTITAMRSNFQAGCEQIASVISSKKKSKNHAAIEVNGVSTPTNASPQTMANNIETLAQNCIDAGYSYGINDTSATTSDLFIAGRDFADNRVSTSSASYKDGYSKGQTAGVNSVKVAHKLTLTSAQTGNNIDIADNWYTTADASAVYAAGVASVKKANKLTLTASQTGNNIDITDNWYTTCDASAVYSAGITSGKQSMGSATVGTGKFHKVGSGTTYTTTAEGLYLGICLYSEDRSYHGEINFYKSGTLVTLDFGRVDKTYPDGGTSYTNFVARAACLLEYCTTGVALSCNRSATWYRVY